MKQIAFFLGLILVTWILTAGEKVGTGPRFIGPVGLQLYSLRAEFTNNVPATVEKVRDYGFKIVETASTYDLTPAKFRELLDKDGLKAVSGHFPFERLRDDVESV